MPLEKPIDAGFYIAMGAGIYFFLLISSRVVHKTNELFALFRASPTSTSEVEAMARLKMPTMDSTV